MRFNTANTLRDFLRDGEPEPARSQVPELLSHPSLTGISRADLDTMTQRIRHLLEARNERHRHRRRGGERLPGARGGVFTQKITTKNGSWPPCSINANCAPRTSSPNCSTSADAPSVTSCARSARSWPRTASPPSQPPLASPTPLPYSPRSHKTNTPQDHHLDSLRSPWNQQRCSLLSGNTSRIAFQKPSAPSPTARTGERMPRRLQSRSRSAHDSADSR